jgi:Zn ribbon nucleic-acid-binding protein
MALRKKGRRLCGDSQSDIHDWIRKVSAESYPAQHLVDAECAQCAGKLFRLAVDDEEGVAIRTCVACGNEHPIGDGGEYLEEASPEPIGCACGQDGYEVTAGVHVREDGWVKWFYLGCRCPNCGDTGGWDWKVVVEDYQAYLLLV